MIGNPCRFIIPAERPAHDNSYVSRFWLMGKNVGVLECRLSSNTSAHQHSKFYPPKHSLPERYSIWSNALHKLPFVERSLKTI